MLDTTFFAPAASPDIARIVALRDASLATLHTAVDTLVETFAATDAVRKDLAGVLRGHSLHTGGDRYGADAVFGSIHSPDRVREALRRQLDVSVWRGLMQLTGFQNLMDATAREQFERQLQGDDVPEVSEATVRATFAGLFEDADTIFKRGIATAFSRLDRRFKSHDGFKVGTRLIITGLIQGAPFSSRSDRAHAMLLDIERAFAVLDGQAPDAEVLPYSVQRGHVYETRYFRIRTFQNGNAHLWMLRDDLVRRVNKLLGEYYGEVLPDAWETAHKDPERAQRSRSTAVSADLQFYATPAAVAAQVAEDCRGKRVLEPSAGEGAMAAEALKAGAARVDCIEVDPGRVGALGARFGHNDRVSVRRANFLDTVPDPVYDLVLMNPPFYGTHYMQHVRHAFEFLKPMGELRAVLPATVEFGESKAHDEFRAWAKRFCGWGKEFQVSDLPVGSFRESGTGVSTVVLRLRKR